VFLLFDGYPGLSICLASGLIFIVMGGILYLRPAKKINSLYGYRTASSTESQERWDFAQKRGGREMMLAGILLILIGIVQLLFSLAYNIQVGISLLALVALCPLMFIRVERAIKNHFPE
jgi:uncharacterized membrane protein